ncbi:MAG TPA: hypothetical protein VKD28_18840 [Gemmatimonadales bacterium]|nr:hypothetical protein [Gemmatimonadales bacterium]
MPCDAGSAVAVEIRHNRDEPDAIVNTPQRSGRDPMHSALAGALAIVTGLYAGLFYAADTVSERDYSAIKDPQLRVGYCMASNTYNPDKYVFAETTVRSPDLTLYSVVMPHALGGVITEQKRAALLALRERDELRVRALRLSFRLADYCGFRAVDWPPGTTPLDVSVKWLQHDSTFLFYVERVRGEPDAADRTYRTLAQSSSGGAKF